METEKKTIADLGWQLTKGRSGCDLLLLGKHSFCKGKVLKYGEVHWRCRYRHSNCKAKIYTIGPEHIVTRKFLSHNHKASIEPSLPKKMALRSQKAKQDRSKKPLEIIKDNPSTNLADKLKTDLNQIRKKEYSSRHKMDNSAPKSTKDQSKSLNNSLNPLVDEKIEMEEIKIKDESIDVSHECLNTSSSSEEEEPKYESTSISNILPSDNQPQQIRSTFTNYFSNNEKNMEAIVLIEQLPSLSSDGNVIRKESTLDSNANSTKVADSPLLCLFSSENVTSEDKFENNEDLLFVLSALANIKNINKIDRLAAKADVLQVLKKYQK